MSGKNNLIPLPERTKEEQRKITSKGGKASGEARRRKKSLKEAMQAALSLPVSNVEMWNSLSKFGISPENIDNQNAIVVAMVIEAMSGNVKAFQAIQNVIGEDNDTERLKLQQKEVSLKEREVKAKDATPTEQPKLYEALEADDDV